MERNKKMVSNISTKRKVLRGKEHPCFGTHHSEETKKKMRLAHTHCRLGMTAEKCPSWKGGILHSQGYTFIYSPNHPFKHKHGKGYVKQSRLIMEEHLRKHDPDHPALVDINGEKYLRKGWCVHHKNGKRDDDRIENLDVLLDSDHKSRHNKGANNPHYGKEPWNKGIPCAESTRKKLALCAQKQNQLRDGSTGRFISKKVEES